MNATVTNIIDTATNKPFQHVRTLMAALPESWLAVLQEVYKIDVVRDGDLVSLKYNMLESPMAEPIVQECRGMVVDTVNRRILAHPYNKFWNYGETEAATIDWTTAQAMAKLDGSLMTLYWDPAIEAWAVASSGTPRAGGSFGKSSETFRDVFWRTFNARKMNLPDQDYRHLCFMFELCSSDPNGRIVVLYDTTKIVLHGARNVETGDEWHIGVTPLGHWALTQIAHDHNWEVVETYPLASIADCLVAAAALDPIKHEGFVVVDGNFNRIKIKSPRYVILHHLKGQATPRGAVRLWQTGESEELLAHFPEFAEQVLAIHVRLDAACQSAVDDVARFGHLPTQKEFAMQVKGKPWSSITFLLHKEAEQTFAGARAIARRMTLAALERLAGIADCDG